MNHFDKLYRHIFNNLTATFSSDGKTAVFTDGADTYEVTYSNSTPVTIRHTSQAAVMRRGDKSAPWANNQR